LPGDRLWIHPDLPANQSAHFVLIVAFLRGTTNPPPAEWFTRVRPVTVVCAARASSSLCPPEHSRRCYFWHLRPAVILTHSAMPSAASQAPSSAPLRIYRPSVGTACGSRPTLMRSKSAPPLNPAPLNRAPKGPPEASASK